MHKKHSKVQKKAKKKAWKKNPLSPQEVIPFRWAQNLFYVLLFLLLVSLIQYGETVRLQYIISRHKIEHSRLKSEQAEMLLNIHSLTSLERISEKSVEYGMVPVNSRTTLETENGFSDVEEGLER